MNKLVSIFFFLFLALSGWGQSADSLNYKGLDLGFTFSPDYSYRILRSDASTDWVRENYDTLEVSKYSFTAGVDVIFHINKNFFIGSGILFSDKGERTKKYETQPVNNYNNHYYFIDVPVKANYYVLTKKVKLFLNAGLSANIHLRSRLVTETGISGKKKSISSSPENPSLNFSIVAGFGIDCPVTNRWYFRLEPTYRRFITPVVDAPLKKYFYSYGLNLGFFYRF